MIYRIPCADCDWCYVGEIGRCLETMVRNVRFARTFENYFMKAIELFFAVYIASKHSWAGRITLCKLTSSGLSGVPPALLMFRWGYVNTEKSALLLKSRWDRVSLFCCMALICFNPILEKWSLKADESSWRSLMLLFFNIISYQRSCGFFSKSVR